MSQSSLPGAVYARISRRYGEKAESLENQDARCAELAAKMGVEVEDLHLQERDSGVETADSRPVLRRLRELALARRIGHVFIHAWDRLSRTPEELVLLWQEFRSHGVTVVCLQFPVHEMDLDMARMLLRMIGMFGEMEFSSTRRRTTENKQRIRDKGMRVGEGGPRFGYRWLLTADGKIDPSRAWIVDEPAAETVRYIFHLVGDLDWSLGRVIEHLNADPARWPAPAAYRGHKYRDGRQPRWTYNISKIVRDETYKGVATCSRRVKVAPRQWRFRPRDQWRLLDHAPTPALVDVDLWDRANQVLDRKRARHCARIETRNTEEFVFLRGIIRCSSCGARMRVVPVHQWNRESKKWDGEVRIAYKCDTRWNKSLPPERRVCDGRRVYDDVVREAAWQAFVATISEPNWIEQKAALLKLERPGEAILRDAIAVAEAEHAATKTQIATLTRRIVAEPDDEVVRTVYRPALDGLMTTVKGLERRLDTLREKVASYDLLDRRVDDLLARAAEIRAGLVDSEFLTWAERRQLLDAASAQFRGSGETLHLELDLRLEEGIGDDEPLVVSDTPSRRNRTNDQRLRLSWDIAELNRPLEAAR